MAEAELTTIARPYARAVFQVGVDSNRLGDWSQLLSKLSAIVSEPTVVAKLESPSLTQAMRAEVLIELCGDELDETARNLLRILAEYERIPALPEIRKLFELLKAEHEKVVEVEVISAYDVSDEDTSRLQAILKEKLNRDIHIESRVDASLLGGLIVKTDDSVVDNSVRGRLAKLTHVMNS